MSEEFSALVSARRCSPETEERTVLAHDLVKDCHDQLLQRCGGGVVDDARLAALQTRADRQGSGQQLALEFFGIVLEQRRQSLQDPELDVETYPCQQRLWLPVSPAPPTLRDDF